ncbi:MAG TPA: nucleotidyltransferase [Polyangiales bacterium]|jgi:predicted nucleotidyltransferase|nr:nucleotidyltransferase [Polyangiales bacterium]
MTESLLARVVHVLEEKQIGFALIGAAAMAARGVSRSTYDTDLFSVGPRVLDDSMWQALAVDGIDVDVRHGDDEDPLLGVVRFMQSDQVIDLVVGRSAWQMDVIGRATPTQVFSLKLPIATVEDLILLKLYAGGTQDRWDIQQLLTSGGAAVGVADIDARVSQLPERCQELWRQLRSA